MLGHETKQDSPENLSKELSLEEAKKLALNAIKVTTQRVMGGSTQFAKESKYLSERAESFKEGIISTRDLHKEYFNSMSRIEPSGEVYQARLCDASVDKYNFANCGELANRNFNFISRQYPNLNTIVAIIKNGDHRFVITDLPDTFVLSKPKTLGNAVFCDSWSGWAMLYKLADLPHSQEYQKYDGCYIAVEKKPPDKGYLFYYCDNGEFKEIKITGEIAFKEKKNESKEIKMTEKLKLTDEKKESRENILQDMLQHTSQRLMHPNEIIYFFGTDNHFKNAVYPATEYKSYLKNYNRYSEGIRKIIFYPTTTDKKPGPNKIILQPAPTDKSKILARYTIDGQPREQILEMNSHLLYFYVDEEVRGISLNPEKGKNVIEITEGRIYDQIMNSCPDAKLPQEVRVIEPLNQHHKVIPLGDLSTRVIQSDAHKQKIMIIFTIKIDILIEAIKQFLTHLSYLEAQSDITIEKRAILREKIQSVKETVKTLYEAKKSCTPDKLKDNYYTLIDGLEKSLNDCIEKTLALKLNHFQPNQLRTLANSERSREIVQYAQATYTKNLEKLRTHPFQLMSETRKEMKTPMSQSIVMLPAELINFIIDIRKKASKEPEGSYKKDFLYKMADRLEHLNLSQDSHIKAFEDDFIIPVKIRSETNRKHQKIYDRINKFKYGNIGLFFASFSQRNSGSLNTKTATRIYVDALKDLIEKYSHPDLAWKLSYHHERNTKLGGR